MAKAEAWAPLFFAGAGRAKRPWLVFMKEVCFWSNKIGAESNLPTYVGNVFQTQRTKQSRKAGRRVTGPFTTLLRN